MLTLSTEHIRMRQQAANKEEALQILADILVADGLTIPEYLNGLKAREAQTSTYLGQGIAISPARPNRALPFSIPAYGWCISPTGCCGTAKIKLIWRW